MTHDTCPYCSGSGIVAHDGAVIGLDDSVDCPLCDGSGISAPRLTTAQRAVRTLRYATHRRESLLVAAAVACGGIVLLALELLGAT